MSSQRMKNADAAWLHMDRPTNLMVVNSVLWFDEPVDRERMRQIIEDRLVARFPRYRQRIAEPLAGVGVPSWEDDPEFDLDRHLHHLALPAPGDKAALQDLVADLMATPLDRAKPLWDLYLVDGYGLGTALVSRMHHCIADGIALSRVMLSLTDEQSDSGIAAQPAANGDHSRLAALTQPVGAGAHLAAAALHEGIDIASHPSSGLLGVGSRAVADSRALAKLLLTGPDAKTVLRGDLGAVQRVAWTDGLPLAEVKAIGAATHTTVNDVLVAAITGALRRYLAGRGTPVEQIRVMVPFNLRPVDEPLPRELGNRFGLVYLSLPLSIEDPSARLQEVHRRMDAIKHSPEGPVSYGILGLMGLTPPPVEQRLIDLFAPKTTAVLTNVPGPRRPIYFAGAKVAGVIGWVPASGGISTGISIFSYNEQVTLGLRVNARLVPDPQTILDNFADELKALTKPRRSAPRRRAARKPAATATRPART